MARNDDYMLTREELETLRAQVDERALQQAHTTGWSKGWAAALKRVQEIAQMEGR